MRLSISLLLRPDQRGDTYFLIYALLKDEQSVNLAAGDLLNIAQFVVRKNIPQSLT